MERHSRNKKQWTVLATVLGVALIFSVIGTTMNFPKTAAYASDEDRTFDNDQQYSAEFLENAFDQLTPYMKINEEDKSLTFDKTAARKDGIAKDVIKAGREFVEMQNENMKIIKEDNNMSSERINKTKIHKFEKFFEAVKEGKTGKTKQVAAENEDMWGLIQYASAAPGDVCGGQQSNPHPAPQWVESGVYRSTQSAIVSIVTGMGYHQTAGYASYNNANDYTKGTSGYGCASPIFRDQIIIWYKSGSGYTYRQQGHIGSTNFGEPNPEIFGYVWPVYWWGSYVQWWHDNF